ncbi:AEC family transporter [Parasporobacterium paucivorans]|uniref:AEC family transporter n=1 Tax=Parasporobacterium paucivorans DSM 15970 TaxID=1122934 RepID=A0A1M6HMS1_9FIRM|nr:AEC family transporter [Parasporobacterium paucivorans]SHJ23434.1 hypothetical protein SAMN02745691_01577 [Parasporobacterium paucivorans DSM 15970]
MENLIFSLNATIPVFLVIMIGYILKKIKMFNENFLNIMNKFNFKLTLPALLFSGLYMVPIREAFDIRYVLYCMLATSIAFWGLWGISKLLVKDKSIIGEFVQVSFRGSAAILGIALIQNLYGDAGMAPLMIIGAVPLFNLYSVIVLTFESGEKQQNTIKNACISVCRNPIIIAILAGLLVSLLGLDFPQMLDTTIDSIARIASPLALLGIGAGFEGKKAIAKMKPTAVASLVKLLILPALLLPVAVWMGFRYDKLIAVLIMLGAPSTPSCYIMARNMGHDGVLTSSVVVATTLLSAFSLTLIIFILRSYNLL